MSQDPFARRLFPRLRVLSNGSGKVNTCRADITTTVVSSSPSLEFETAGLVQAQERLPSLDATPLTFGAGRLPKRQKLAKEGPADDAFVNVFIDVLPELDATPDQADDRDATPIPAIQEFAKGESSVRGAIVRRGNLISATVPISMLDALKQDKNIEFVGGSQPLKLDVPDANTATRPRARSIRRSDLHKHGENVIIGIIDVGGFDFAHPDFLDDKGNTRFIAIWDQGGNFRDPPERFKYGTEFRKEHLDRAIRDAETTGFPATELERQSQRRDASHGTHVASIAAGKQGVCQKADIAAVLVDIPTPDSQQEQRRWTFSDSSRIAHAVDYLLDIAEERGKPISINISLGTNGGTHDGSDGATRWLDHALMTPGRAICVAAGNSGQEAPAHDEDIGWIMGRIHTSGRIPSRGLDVDLEWVVVGNGIADVSENELEIWYSPQDRFSVSVQPPGEDRWYEVKPRQFRENERLSDGTTLSIFNELYHPNNGANYISIYLSPNLDPENVRGVKAGVWKVRLHGEDIRDGRFHAWIERDDPGEVGRDEKQRFFRFPSFFTARSNVDSHSISSLACGRYVVAVGNADTERGQVNVSSSQGPTRDDRTKPDVVAPGTDIVAARGFSLDGSEWVSMTGTSMASPYVAGVVGLMLSTNPDLNAAQCGAILQRTAQPLPGDSYSWQNDSGFGQITPEAAIEDAHTFTARTPST